MQTIPAQLDWLPIANDLTSFVALIGDTDEYFTIVFDADQPEGYEWRLFISRPAPGQTVFLHGHEDLFTAKTAAYRHLGME